MGQAGAAPCQSDGDGPVLAPHAAERFNHQAVAFRRERPGSTGATPWLKYVAAQVSNSNRGTPDRLMGVGVKRTAPGDCVM